MTFNRSSSDVPRRRRSAGAVIAWMPGAVLILRPGTVDAQCAPTWQDVGGVWGSKAAPLAALVYSMDTFEPAGERGRRLYIGGSISRGGAVPALRAVSYDASSWQALGAGIGNTITSSWVYNVKGVQSSVASGLHAGVMYSGSFYDIGSVVVSGLARWSAPTWVAAGEWNWSRHSAALHTLNGTTLLFSGGMGNANDKSLPFTVAQWDGVEWVSTGGGVAPLPPQESANVYSLEKYDDDGAGPRPAGLYAAGKFWYAGSVEVRNIARWDGVNWEALDSGTQGSAESLCVFDSDGPGPLRERLFVGGQFDFASGVKADGLGCWDGQQWDGVGGWSHGPVKCMAVFDDDGPGPRKPALFVGGFFNNTPGGLGNQIARWDGQQWSVLPGATGAPGVTGWGMSTQVMALAVYDEDGDGPNPGGLYVGGFFTHAGGAPMNSIARWGCPAPAQCYANCNLDFHPVTGQHILGVADFGCFQTHFVLQDPYADCDADAALTVQDFGCFQTRFVAGCP